MAGRQSNSDSDEQLDLFTAQRPTHDTTDPVRTDGRETLARTLPEDSARTGADGAASSDASGSGGKDEMATLRTQLMTQGSTAQQAHDQAWEMVREKYILLPPEE